MIAVDLNENKAAGSCGQIARKQIILIKALAILPNYN